MDKKLPLLESSDSEIEFKINEDYAKSYSKWRNKEELQKYKDLKKEISESSSSESEVEIQGNDYEFYRVLSFIRGDDPRLKDKNFVLFTNETVQKKTKIVKSKPMYMKDYTRKLVLERGGKFSDEDEHIPTKGPTYDQEQEELKKSFKAALSDSDDNDDLLKVRTKTKKEKKTEEEDYVRWLKGEDVDISEEKKSELIHLRKDWADPNISEKEKFLRDFFLNKPYLEEDEDYIPTYEEIVSGALSDDEKMVEEQEKFEHKYNFRYEEPDEEFIKRYPRTVKDSLRKTDNKRKQQRQERTERKKRDKEQRQEELKRLKALKRKEIEEKFLKIKEIVGENDLNLNESDIESDFDPDKHDKKMKEMFDDDYYKVEEVQKPEFPYDEELDAENWNTWTRSKSVEENVKYESSEETAAHDNEKDIDNTKPNTNLKEEFEKEMINACLPRKKAQKKSLFAKVILEPKPIYDTGGKSFDEYLDEYYKLDYEDVVGGMPVRYKYRKVVPNDFGLSIDEILAANDKELNRWCHVNKTHQYRNDDEELYDVQAFKKKSENLKMKKKVLPSIYAPEENNNEGISSNSKNYKDNITSVKGDDYYQVDLNQSNDLNKEKGFSESSISQSFLNKSRKKRKLHQNSLNAKSEYENSEVQYEQKNINYESEKNIIAVQQTTSQDKNNFKSSKRKRDSENNFPFNMKSESLNAIIYSPSHKEKKQVMENAFFDVSILDSNSTSNNDPEDNNRKKKRKKKKHNSQNETEGSSLIDIACSSQKEKKQVVENRDSNSAFNDFPEGNSRKKKKHNNQNETLGSSLNDIDCFSSHKKKKQVFENMDSNPASNNVPEEKSRKKKRKEKKHNNQNETVDSSLNDTIYSSNKEKKQVIENMDSNSDFNDVPEENTRKKNKHKNQNETVDSSFSLNDIVCSSHKENKHIFENMDSNSASNNVPEEETKKKKRKKKKHNSQNETVDIMLNDVGFLPSHNEKKQVENMDSYSASKNVPEGNTRKKKRKKKKQNSQNKTLNSTVQDTGTKRESTVSYNQVSKSNIKDVPQDKRLGLSDERLKAYGINPKKFKHKIMYSKK